MLLIFLSIKEKEYFISICFFLVSLSRDHDSLLQALHGLKISKEKLSVEQRDSSERICKDEMLIIDQGETISKLNEKVADLEIEKKYLEKELLRRGEDFSSVDFKTNLSLPGNEHTLAGPVQLHVRLF